MSFSKSGLVTSGQFLNQVNDAVSSTSAAGVGPLPTTSRLLTVGDVAERLSICKRGVYRLIANGNLRTVKVMKSTRIFESDLAAYLQQLLKGGARD